MIARAVLFGTLAAAAVAGWTLLEFALGFHTTRAEVGRWTGFVGLVFPVVAIVAALRRARRARGGRLPLGAALGEGAGVSAVLALLSGASLWAYYVWLNPGFRIDGRPAVPGEQALVAAAGSFVAGLVITLVAALALRPRAPGGAARPA